MNKYNKSMKDELIDFLLGCHILDPPDEAAQDLLDDDWIKLPCKSFDIFYVCYPVTGEIEEKEVFAFRENELIDLDYNSYSFDEIGTRIFFTKEEAYKALKLNN